MRLVPVAMFLNVTACIAFFTGAMAFAPPEETELLTPALNYKSNSLPMPPPPIMRIFNKLVDENEQQNKRNRKSLRSIPPVLRGFAAVAAMRKLTKQK